LADEATCAEFGERVRENLSSCLIAKRRLPRAVRHEPRPLRMSDRPRTLYEKIWDAHVVERRDDGTCLIYIDRHLVHEVTSRRRSKACAWPAARSAGPT
jgi:hypothetical protein